VQPQDDSRALSGGGTVRKVRLHTLREAGKNMSNISKDYWT
jgi:hypothetical protein